MHLREIKTVQKGALHTRSVSDSSKKEEYLVTNNQDNLAGQSSYHTQAAMRIDSL